MPAGCAFLLKIYLYLYFINSDPVNRKVSQLYICFADIEIARIESLYPLDRILAFPMFRHK